MSPALPVPASPPVPEDERARLDALHRYRILDSGAEISFDDVAALAAAVTQTPVALVSLVDEGRAWFKARVGLDVPEAPREIAFCSWAVAEPGQALQVPDLREDARFAGNPLVVPDDGFRAYTGVPLVTEDGHALGTLCVLDHTPKALDGTQLEALTRLARTVMSHIEARRVAHALLSVTQVLDEVRGLHQLAGVEALAARARELAVQVTEADDAVLLLPTPDGAWRRADGADGSLGPVPADGALPALRHGEAVLDRLAALRDRTPADGLATALHLPLLRDGVLHGLLVVHWHDAVSAVDDTLLRVLEVVAHEAGYALTELQARSVMRDQAETDALTGLANRRRANAQLREWPDSVVALVDLDHFKRVNDDLGHAAGDTVLQRFAVALARRARAGDLVSRWGGEEFLVALPGGTEQALVDLLERVREDLRAAGRDIAFSAGVAAAQPGERLGDTLRRADVALYEAKHAGRARTTAASDVTAALVPAQAGAVRTPAG